jgi:DNA-directed RNA polymerase subunit L
MDSLTAKKKWDEHKTALEAKKTTAEDIQFEKVNFQLLDAQRYYIDNSFDFTIQTIGIYSNKEIIKETCKVLNKKFQDLIDGTETDIIPIHMSETTIDNCWNIVLENEDYTIGKILEYILYENFYKKDKSLSFCGFRKLHPHNLESIIRVAYSQPSDRNKVRYHLKYACEQAISVVNQINRLF